MNAELVEVLSNPRGTKCEVSLTPAQVKRGLATPKKKRKKATEVATTKKKKKKAYRRKPKNDELQLIIGAAIAGAIEVMVFRNLTWSERIPPQIRQFSGAIMAIVGFMMAKMKYGKGMGDLNGVGKGMMAAGAYLQISDALVKARKDQVISEAQKIMAEALASVKGLGAMTYDHRIPRAPHMSTRQAAIALGMDSRVPFHPHGMGDLGVFVDGPGLGELVDLPHSLVTDPSLDPRLDPAGLGELTDSGNASNWMEGQFAFHDDDYGDNW